MSMSAGELSNEQPSTRVRTLVQGAHKLYLTATAAMCACCIACKGKARQQTTARQLRPLEAKRSLVARATALRAALRRAALRAAARHSGRTEEGGWWRRRSGLKSERPTR